jgi:hypothetical protein
MLERLRMRVCYHVGEHVEIPLTLDELFPSLDLGAAYLLILTKAN